MTFSGVPTEKLRRSGARRARATSGGGCSARAAPCARGRGRLRAFSSSRTLPGQVALQCVHDLLAQATHGTTMLCGEAVDEVSGQQEILYPLSQEARAAG